MIRQDNHLYEFEPFVLDAGSRILLKDGATVRLTPKAFETLLVLVQHALQVVEKEQLLNEVWPDTFVEEGSLSYNIHELRRALGDDSSEPRYIETIPKRGYRFVAPVKVSAVNAWQIGLTGAEDDATVIEKHTFARVISNEFEGTDLPAQAAPLSPVAGGGGSCAAWHHRATKETNQASGGSGGRPIVRRTADLYNPRKSLVLNWSQQG